MGVARASDRDRRAGSGLARLARSSAVLVILSLGFALLGGAGAPAGPAMSPALSLAPSASQVARRETRATLDSALFVGRAAAAHKVAREFPEVLDQLYCYCRCDKHKGHNSLLSCYTDGHAAT
jgi:hypothetical protein